MAACSWNGCEEEATGAVALDYGSEECPECHNVRTKKMHFDLCEAHKDQYAETGDNSLLIVNATGEMN